MQTATVFNVQKFSLDDGPGIRTVVFLKGCPLRCYWCSNPESQLRRPQLEWNARSCVGCRACLAACPGTPAAGPDERRHVDVRAVDAESPEARAAVAGCPGRALSVAGRTRTTEDVFEECMQDEPFYRQSAGGVTLSGGEPLTWPDFCVELLGLLREAGVDTNVETTAHVPARDFERVTELLSHAYIDMKHWDAAAHRKGTGVESDLILANTRAAIERGVDVLVRTPVIPGFNDRVEDARRFAERLHEVGATRVQLLPFHNLGESKYDLLGRDYRLHGLTNLHEEDLEGFRQAYLDAGIDAFF